MYHPFHNRALRKANRADAVVQFIVYARTVALVKGRCGRIMHPVKRWEGKVNYTRYNGLLGGKDFTNSK
jgi:hypothetical protein